MPLDVTVVSAEQEVWSGTATQVSAHTTEGDIGLRPGHTPLLALLGEGHVRVTGEGGEHVLIEADQGFIAMDRDAVQVVARRAALASAQPE